MKWQGKGLDEFLGGIDPGIRNGVRILQENGIETCQSCEGGPGHAYPEATVDFLGGPDAGWKALGVCFAFGLKVMELRRVWSISGYAQEPDGPIWQITFRREGRPFQWTRDGKKG